MSIENEDDHVRGSKADSAPRLVGVLTLNQYDGPIRSEERRLGGVPPIESN
jgi:hypothetical protein